VDSIHPKETQNKEKERGNHSIALIGGRCNE
jgi:hypothetical protein